MQNITSAKELKEAIQLIEVEQSANGLLLKEQFLITIESFKPVKLIEGAYKDIISTPSLKNNLLGTTIGLVAGYFSKKVAVGKSDNVFRKLFGSYLQLGVTNLIARHPEAIKSLGQYVIDQVFSKKERIHEPGE